MQTALVKPEREQLQITACPHPFRMERKEIAVPVGLTLSDILRITQPDPVLRQHAHIYLNTDYIPRKHWSRVKPKLGVKVIIRVVPGDIGGGSLVGKIMAIALVVAAFTLGPVLGVALGVAEAGIFGLGILTPGIVGGLLIGAGGMLLSNALAPPPGAGRSTSLASLSGGISGGTSIGRDSPTLFVTGTRNQAIPFGVVPRSLGKHRIIPPLGAKPYTEVVGNDQYLRMLFVWGYGPLNVSNIKIAETPITEFDDVEIETRQGYDTDSPLTLFPDDVNEEVLQLLLKQVDGWHTRTTQPDVDEISIDIVFPRGLIGYSMAGARETRTLNVSIESRPVGGSWTSVTTLSITAQQTSAIRRGHRWTVSRGQYEVRVKRDSEDTDHANIIDEVRWTALRSFINEDPIKMPGVAKTAIRIKATNQLHGVIDQLNGIVESILPDWNGFDWNTKQATSNPASIYREILQGAANARPLADSRIDLSNLQDWHDKNAAEGREFNMVVDFQSTVQQTLSDAAATGRAAPAINDGLWGVVIDEAQTTPIQHFTMRNSWDFSGQKMFLEMPHGWRVRFVNREKDWRQDERIVYDDGYSEANATKFEGLELPGITDPEQVWKDGRYHIATARLRPEIYSFHVDVEHIVCTRGDLVRVTHDVPLWGLASGRVKSIQDNGTNATGVTLYEPVTMEPGKSYSIRFRHSDGSTSVQVVDTDPGEQDTLTFTTPFPLAEAPSADDLFMFGETGSESVELIVKAIEPGADLTARIIAVDASPAVHTADQGTIPAFDSQITLPPTPEEQTIISIPAIDDIRSDETVLLRSGDGALHTRILVTLGDIGSVSEPINLVEAQIRINGTTGDWSSSIHDVTSEIFLTNVEDGQAYDIRLRFRSGTGIVGPWAATSVHTVIGKSTAPPDVSTLLLNGDTLSWAYASPPPDFAGFKVKHIPGTDAVWASALAAHDGLITENTFDISNLPKGVRTIMVKAVDVADNESLNTVTLIKDLGDELVDNVLITEDLAAQGFPGTISGGTVVGDDLEANDDSVLYLPEASALYLTDDNALYLPVSYDEMFYTHGFMPEQADIPSRLTLDANIIGESWAVEYHSGGDDLYLPDVSALYLPNESDLYLGGVPAFSPWPGSIDVTRQMYELRARVAAGSVQGIIYDFALNLDVPDLLDYINDFALIAAGARLPLTKTFRSVRNVSLTLQDDAGDAEIVRVLDKNKTGPLVKAFDSGGSGASALIDAILQGY